MLRKTGRPGRSNRRRRFCVVLAVLLGSTLARAELPADLSREAPIFSQSRVVESGSIGGRITEGNAGAPLAGLLVVLGPESPDAAEAGPRFTLTDAFGRYLFEDLPPGVYHLLFGAVRSRATAGGVRVVDGAETRLDATVALPLAAAWESVTVRAERHAFETSGPSEFQVAGRAIAERPAALQDPFRAIAGSAGIVSQNDFKSDLWVRGGEAAETEVLLDGLPLPQPYHFSGSGGSAVVIGGDLVEELDVRTGGFSVEYGDALAGVVDIVTREEPTEKLTGQVSAGTILGQATIRGPAGEGQWALSGRRASLGLYDRRVEEEGIGSIAFQDVLGRFTMPLQGSGRLDLSVLEAGDDFSQSLGGEDRAALLGSQRAVRGAYTGALDARTFLRVMLSQGEMAARGSVTGGASYDQHQERQDLACTLLRRVGESHRLSAGLGVSRTRGSIEGEVDEGYAIVPNRVHGPTRAAGVFVEDLWRSSGRLALRYGLRVDQFSVTGQSTVSPRTSAEFRIEPHLTLRAAIGRFVQFPRPEQVFLADGEPLGRQIADHFILGVERAFGSARLTVEAYLKEMRDVAGEALNRYVDLPELMTRFERGRARGLDATFERAGSGPWRLRVDYSHAVALQEKDGLVYPRNTDRRHAASALVGRRLPRGWDVSGVARYGSGLPYTPQVPWSNGLGYGVSLGPLNSARLPVYYRLDLRLARSVPAAWGRLSAYLDLINVTNHRNLRSRDLLVDPQSGSFEETERTQSPFLPVFGLTAEF